MSLLVFIFLIGFPTVGALTAWVVALRSWRTTRSQIPPSSDAREARGRLIPLLVLPSTLIVFGLVVSLLLLGETIPDSVAQPAGLAYGVPGLLAGLGMAIVYRRGISTAVASKQMFGRVLPLAVMPDTSAIFGLVVSFFLIGGGSNPTGGMPFGVEVTWLASALAMVGGAGALVIAWVAASSWDFTTTKTWSRALTRSGGGGMLTVACFALALAVLGEWLILALVVLYFGGIEGVGVVLFMRARRKRLRGTKPS